jgi:hypothetical protein
MLRNGDFGIYKGEEYRLNFHSDDTVDLVSDIALPGFSSRPESREYYRNIKQVDLDSAFSIDPIAEYCGLKVGVRSLGDDEVLIFTDGDYDDMIEKGFKYRERGVYEKHVQIGDLKNIREDRSPLDLRRQPT